MKDALTRLMKVKSIWSLGALAAFLYLTISGKISGDIAMATVATITTYYFTKHDLKE